jgi:hypothetical protein
MPPGSDINQLPDVADDASDWNTLRAQEAENVVQSSKESVGEDYRGMVGAYFQALSKKSQKE